MGFSAWHSCVLANRSCFRLLLKNSSTEKGGKREIYTKSQYFKDYRLFCASEKEINCGYNSNWKTTNVSGFDSIYCGLIYSLKSSQLTSATCARGGRRTEGGKALEGKLYRQVKWSSGKSFPLASETRWIWCGRMDEVGSPGGPRDISLKSIDTRLWACRKCFRLGPEIRIALTLNEIRKIIAIGETNKPA